MKLTDKILKMKQDMSDFDKEVLIKLREIHETVSVVRDRYYMKDILLVLMLINMMKLDWTLVTIHTLTMDSIMIA